MEIRRSLPILVSLLLAGCSAEPVAEEPVDETSEEALTRAQCRGAIGETEAKCRLEGVVDAVFAGEIDPFVGDTCVTFVKVGSRRYGLVSDLDACRTEWDGANVKVSFSKGALDLESRSRSKVLKEYDASATYYAFSGELRESQPSGLAAFDALSDDAKVSFLYDVHPGDVWANLRPGFTKKAIRIVDTQTGEALRKALDAYGPIAQYSYGNGGSQPDVYAVQKDGVTYAYGIEASGRSWGNWGAQSIFDRAWNELATYSYAD
jgi:hypothetical protein